MTRYPIIHASCGNQVLWYTGTPHEHEAVRSCYVTYLDGSAVKLFDKITCPHCKKLAWPGNVKRLLDKPYEI
jgi:hypothetical protein